MGAVIGLDFGAVMTMGAALGVDAEMLADVLPSIETEIVSALTPEQGE